MQNRLIDRIISPGEDLKNIVFNAEDKKLYVNSRAVEDFPDMYFSISITHPAGKEVLTLTAFKGQESDDSMLHMDDCIFFDSMGHQSKYTGITPCDTQIIGRCTEIQRTPLLTEDEQLDSVKIDIEKRLFEINGKNIARQPYADMAFSAGNLNYGLAQTIFVKQYSLAVDKNGEPVMPSGE